MVRKESVQAKDLVEDGLEVRSHLEPSIINECAYCGLAFREGEIVIEREIHGRTWRFCCDEHLRDFDDAIQFQDEDLDAYDPVLVGDPRETE